MVATRFLLTALAAAGAVSASPAGHRSPMAALHHRRAYYGYANDTVIPAPVPADSYGPGPAAPSIPLVTGVPSVPSADAPAPSADVPASSADVPAPSADVPAPSADVPAPSADVPAPSADLPAPSSYAPAPSADVPVVEQPISEGTPQLTSSAAAGIPVITAAPEQPITVTYETTTTSYVTVTYTLGDGRAITKTITKELPTTVTATATGSEISNLPIPTITSTVTENITLTSGTATEVLGPAPTDAESGLHTCTTTQVVSTETLLLTRIRTPVAPTVLPAAPSAPSAPAPPAPYPTLILPPWSNATEPDTTTTIHVYTTTTLQNGVTTTLPVVTSGVAAPTAAVPVAYGYY